MAGLPVLYCGYLDPKPLNDRQQGDLLAFIQDAEVDVKNIWFVYVRSTYKDTCRAQIFLKPMAIAGRVRQGKYLGIDTMITREQRKVFAERLKQQFKPQQSDYIQIAPTEAAIDGKPEEVDTPFPMPEKWDSEDVMIAVDLARATAKKNREIEQGPMPVQRITTDAAGTITVRLGWQAHGLAGHGNVISLKRDGKSFSVVAVSSWMS